LLAHESSNEKKGKKMLLESQDDGTVVVSGIVASRIILERPMTDREHEQLLATATDRFERRLSGEAATLRAGDSAIQLGIANLRVDLSEEDAATRLEIAKVRLDLSEQDAATRLEIAKLRLDLSEQFGESRVHTESRHRELLKWAIVFWVSQAAAVAGIVRAFT
jgi:hypothetical protein